MLIFFAIVLFAQQQAIDPKTTLIMYKLVNSGILEAINGVISAGKESVVFHADGGRFVLDSHVYGSNKE